jgi:ferredoxin/predicted CopG family antitoxin
MHPMTPTKQVKETPLDDGVYQMLLRAQKPGESLSDVILRLTSMKLFGLQRRGEEEIVTSDGMKLLVGVDQDLCMGAESCVALAPRVFSLDETQLGRRKSTEPLGMIRVEPGTIQSAEITTAAKACPYQAIRVRDSSSGNVLAP